MSLRKLLSVGTLSLAACLGGEEGNFAASEDDALNGIGTCRDPIRLSGQYLSETTVGWRSPPTTRALHNAQLPIGGIAGRDPIIYSWIAEHSGTWEFAMLSQEGRVGTEITSIYGIEIGRDPVYDTFVEFTIHDTDCSGAILASRQGHSGNANYTSLVPISAIRGKTYIIEINTVYESTPGWYKLSIGYQVPDKRNVVTASWNSPLVLGSGDTYFRDTTDENATGSIHGTCGGAGAPERVYRWLPPSAGRWRIETWDIVDGIVGPAWDSVLYIRRGDGSEIDCDDDDVGGGGEEVVIDVSASDAAAGLYLYIVVDGNDDANDKGDYELEITDCPDCSLTTR